MIHEYDITKSFYEYDQIQKASGEHEDSINFDQLPVEEQVKQLKDIVQLLSVKNTELERQLSITEETLRVAQEELKMKLKSHQPFNRERCFYDDLF